MTVTVTSPPAPTVSISADPESIIYGESATLSWSSTDVDSDTIDQGVGEVDPNGSTAVSPEMITTYTITVTGPGGMASAKATVAVTADTEPPPEGSKVAGRTLECPNRFLKKGPMACSSVG